MGYLIDNLEGERIDSEDASTEELERIRADIFDWIARKVNITPTSILLDEVDIIDDELSYRATQARAEDRAEAIEDDRRIGL